MFDKGKLDSVFYAPFKHKVKLKTSSYCSKSGIMFVFSGHFREVHFVENFISHFNSHCSKVKTFMFAFVNVLLKGKKNVRRNQDMRVL